MVGILTEIVSLNGRYYLRIVNPPPCWQLWARYQSRATGEFGEWFVIAGGTSDTEFVELQVNEQSNSVMYYQVRDCACPTEQPAPTPEAEPEEPNE